jgi:sigma-B regulation protein RsbU (phosphoserine phosphatase)
VGGLDDIAGLFTRPAAIFLETHLWPLLRHEGRFDECHVHLRLDDGHALACFASARWFGEGPARRVAWLFYPAIQRARFEAALIGARSQALLEASELDRLAHTDALTGLANRRALDAAFAAHGEGGGALLVIDADHFKAINDRWGHHVGDAVLAELGAALRQCVRRSDCAVRLGGEEFALWLPEADREVAGRVADAVHERVSTIRVPDGDGLVTVSIGIACRGSGERTHPLDLIQRADTALYAAKAEGRNRTAWSR